MPGRKIETLELIESIRWLQSKGTAYFYAKPAQKSPCWNILLQPPSPELQSLVIQDTAMLKVLFDLYPARLEECDAQMGLAPIHYAALNGWLEVVVTLLDRGVNVNLESSRPEALRTAVFMAIARAESGKPPDWTTPGGQLEIRRWRERVHEIVRVLIAAGAQLDSGADAYQRRVLNVYSTPLTSSMTIIRNDETHFVEDDDALGSLWPERLPEAPMDEEMTDNKTNMRIRNAVGDIIKVNRLHALETLDGVFRSSLAEVMLSADFNAWFRAKAMSREQEYKMRAELSPSSAIELEWMSIISPRALKAKNTAGEPEFDLTSLRQPLKIQYDNKNNNRQRYEADMELITRACSLDHRIYLGDGLYSSLYDVEKIENDNLALLGAAMKMSIEEAEDRKQLETHVEEDETGEVNYKML